jgi:transglutaminase-like putative cysteine protease
MMHKGSYEFDYGPHLEMVLNGTTVTFSSSEPVKESVEEISENKEVISESSSIETSKNIETLSINNSTNDKFYNLASSITNRANSDYAKARRIYQWVSKNISYDRSKYMRILNNDYSDKYGADVALSTGTGVCYDYAALVVELSKSVGLNAKLVKGNYTLSNGTVIYHAWNEIYISEMNKWIKLDTSSASVYGRNYFNSIAFNKNYEKTGEE